MRTDSRVHVTKGSLMVFLYFNYRFQTPKRLKFMMKHQNKPPVLFMYRTGSRTSRQQSCKICDVTLNVGQEKKSGEFE